ncbi:hypothetical protein B0T10DRAFT_533768 [Thelonectria olida]|uniref:Deoxyribose-phosphate aldolase n=1 Tax=Thelonectria olida TaxID=1576542 RepID=A0A9P9AJW5_9HYPO|nr:hypothetical protein B0T10DRAFT_533768 [Thelonectria olida]
MTTADILEGLRISKQYGVATACVKPYLIPLAQKELEGSGVQVCSVIGFSHGNSTAQVKVFEADAAVAAGERRLTWSSTLVWLLVESGIRQINDAVTKHGALLKVIFENDYLEEHHIIKLCEICSAIGVGFVKTSTGYGFAKQSDGKYSYKGATVPHLKLMRLHSKPEVQVKAAGGVRTLDHLLHVMSLAEAARRGITDVPTTVEFKLIDGGSGCVKRQFN